MKKNINKLIALGIGISVMSSSIVPALAASTTNINQISTSNSAKNTIKVLTLEDAVNAAVNKDEQISIYSSTINYYKGLEDYYDEVDDDNGEDENDINLNSAKQSREFRKDGVEYEITNLYNSIILAQKQLELQNEVVSNENVKTNNMKLKAENGLIDSVSMSKQEANLKKEKDTLQANINSLNDLKEKLRLYTGININDYALDEALNYEKLKIDGDLDSYIDDKINTITKYDRELVELSKDTVDDMKDDDYDDLDDLLPDEDSSKYKEYDEEGTLIGYDKNAYASDYTTALTNYKTYLGAKLSSETNSAKLKVAEKTYTNSLRNTYSNILAIEDGIDQLITNIEITNKSLAHTKLQYQLGLMTANEYNTAVAGYKQLDISLRQTLNQYYQLKTAFEKPWAASNASS